MFLFGLVLLLVSQAAAQMHVSDFSSGIFKTSQPKGIWPVFTGTYDSSGQILIAYSDFNGDKYIDMVTLDNLSQAATIYLWNPKMSIYIPTLLNGTGSPIISVIPSDYDLDGTMDILIVIEVNNTYEIHMQLMDNVDDYKCTLKDQPLESNLFTGLDPVEPFLMDPKGTGIPSIAVVQGGQRSILTTNEGTTQQQMYLFSTKSTFASLIENIAQASLPALSNHQAALVDFSGDCRSDLVMLSQNPTTGQQYLQFFQLDTNGTYTMPQNITLNNPISRINFADLNFDGAIDLLAIINLSNTYVLEVHYNNHPNNDALCKGDSSFPYDFTEGNAQRIIIPFNLINLINTSMLSLGDVNSDGFPDILTTLQDSNNNTKAYLLLNIACTSGNKDCEFGSETQAMASGQPRTFVYNQIGDAIRDISQSVLSVSFTDIAFDGQLDVMVNVFNASGSSYSLVGIINNLNEDAFFIKALPLTSFSSEDDSRLVSSFGVTFQWKITTLEGNYVNSVAGQLMQQTDRALQLPFVCVGLGRTNNYLEDFTVVYMGDGNNQSWTPVIPNSQLLVIPSGTDQEWNLGIYISSIDKIKQVVVITAIILILIGVLIMWLIRKENEEDRRNQFMFFQLIR